MGSDGFWWVLVGSDGEFLRASSLPQELTKEIKECSEFKEFKERTQIPNFTNLPKFFNGFWWGEYVLIGSTGF